ncbi:MAG TPA: hypothetical protein VIP77_05175 [Jiangellaceae bacterium]
MTTNQSRRNARAVSTDIFVHVHADAVIDGVIEHDQDGCPYVVIGINDDSHLGVTLFIRHAEALVNLLAQVDMAYQELTAAPSTVDEDGEAA